MYTRLPFVYAIRVGCDSIINAIRGIGNVLGKRIKWNCTARERWKSKRVYLKPPEEIRKRRESFLNYEFRRNCLTSRVSKRFTSIAETLIDEDGLRLGYASNRTLDSKRGQPFFEMVHFVFYAIPLGLTFGFWWTSRRRWSHKWPCDGRVVVTEKFMSLPRI